MTQLGFKPGMKGEGVIDDVEGESTDNDDWTLARWHGLDE